MLEIAEDDPRRPDVRELLEQHLAFAHEVTPTGFVHALGLDGLLDPSVTFFSARRDGVLVGVGALRELGPSHGEVKSMHTAASARGKGVGRAMVVRLLEVARSRGYERVSLETGTTDGFAPARRLYESMGFEACEPYEGYAASPHNMCMTLALS